MREDAIDPNNNRRRIIMTRSVMSISLTLALLALGGASRLSAIMYCSECACDVSCTATCINDPGPNGHCGDTGYCFGGSNCGTGCLTLKNLAELQLDPKLMTPADPARGRLMARLTWRLAQYAEESGLGEVHAAETGLLPGARGWMQAPALSFVRNGRLGAIGTPDLAIEIRSAVEPPAVLAEKVRSWLAAGTRTVLVINPSTKTIAVHRNQTGVTYLRADDLLEAPDLLPGWSVRVGDLFE